ncbi:hypothetical protein PHYPSEUDO_010373 [Phytophthora pseudosyringae]|uniref:Uncharacterized protein n=1 Tax=Phytophthora pseudosyringae TaxID=221518 RepID=A0A8T1W9R2_9STRA|nr:hypothetical protein PHYPSEUDO_010373 [Phytophthora pseudosyringae]
MKVASEKGGGASTVYTQPRLAHLENMLQELTRAEEWKRQQSVKSASVATKHKLLSDQLLQTQEELAAAQASKAKLYEEVGTLKQTKEHQAKQLDKYKLHVQAARESQTAMTKKMEELEASTWSTKQQYIRSLASRIKTSALVLQQLNLANGASFSARIAETCNEWEKKAKPNKRKRIMEENEKQQAIEDGSKPKHTGVAAEVEPQSRDEQHSDAAVAVDPVAAAKANTAVVLTECRDSISSVSCETNEPKQQEDDRSKSAHLITELQAHVAKLEAEYSALNDKYKLLACEHNEVLADSTTSAQDIKAKESKIEELMQMQETSRSKQPDAPAIESPNNDAAKETLEGRLKLLEENLAQMNGYADQLEMVIAQCPSCTVKLQNESTQDSITNRAE